MVLRALAGTALVFSSLSAYALNTERFLLYERFDDRPDSCGCCNDREHLLAIPALSLTLSAVVVMIMAGLILFDIAVLFAAKRYIRATVGLYLNIFNLLLFAYLIAVFTGDD